MPVRRHAADEEEFRIVEVTRNLDEARHLLAEVGRELNKPAIDIDVEPHVLGRGRAVGHPLVWEWIGTLQAVRTQLAALMSKQGMPVPDDLPDGSWAETTLGSPTSQAATTVLFALVVLGLVIALVLSALG